jgi:glycosyltransferase involved in cell wall biosynthesis
VLLVSASSGSEGGGELYLAGLAEGLKSLGHSIEVLLASHPRMDGLARLLEPWGTVHREEFPNTYDRRLRVVGAVLDRRLIRRLSCRFREISSDVIHINKQNLEDGLDLVAAASRSRLPFVSTIHITRSPESLGAAGGWVRNWVARFALRRAASPCLATARGCAVELNDWFGESPARSRIHCVLNGVRAAPSSDREAIRREWNCRDGDLVLGCLARIEHQKNPLFLVELLPHLPQRARLVWVGDGRLRGELLATAERLGVQNRIHIDGWRSDARQRLAGFDVFVLPSRYEGFPFAVLEAMAAGLPCIASDVDGTREAIINGESGLLCPSGDRDAWLACLRTLIDNEAQRKAIGLAAHSRYLDHFSLGAMARGTVDVYRSVISQARR